VKIKGLFKMAALNVKYGIDEDIGRCIMAIVVNKPYFIERDQKRQKEGFCRSNYQMHFFCLAILC